MGLAEQVGVAGAAKQFGLHESQLYAWRKKARYEASRSETGKSLAIENAKLKRQVAKQAEELALLKKDEQGHKYNRKTVAASMKRQGLAAKAAKKYKAATDSDHNLPVAPNPLEQDFTAEAPNQKWVCDITYLWTGEGWLYLAMALDLFSRMGWWAGHGQTHEGGASL